MQSRTHGQKTVRNRSEVGAGELTLNTGMTLWEYRQRSGRRHNGKPPTMPCLQCNGASGANTSGALAGLRATRFPNPPTGQPPRDASCSPNRERSAFASLTIGAGNRVITGKCEIYDKSFRDWNVRCTLNCTK